MREFVDYNKIDLPRDAEGPVFEKPWQAQAFAIVVQLNKAGAFTWEEWVGIFSKVIRGSPALEGERTNDAYYRQWLAAMEQMVMSKGLIDPASMLTRTEEWRQAHLNTPHGHPIALSNAACAPSHHHEHHVHSHEIKPVTVSPARMNGIANAAQ